MVKTFCMLLKTSFPSYLQWISITSISKWGKAIKPFVYAKCPESSTRQLPPEVSAGLASSNCSEEVWVIPEPTHAREGSPRLEMELPCIVVIRSAGETGECGVGHAGNEGSGSAGLPPCSFSCSLSRHLPTSLTSQSSAQMRWKGGSTFLTLVCPFS